MKEDLTMVNKFNALHVQGKSLGKLRYKGQEKKGTDDVTVARLNVNGSSSNALYLQPQAGFDFAEQETGDVKVIDVTVQAGKAKSNSRNGAKVAVYIGTILPLTDTHTDSIPESEFDAVLVTGADLRPVGRVRSKDALDVNNMAVYGSGYNLKQDRNNREDGLARDVDGNPIISGYYLDLVPADKKKGITENDIVRIHVSPAVHDKHVELFEDEARVVPLNLKFAFSTLDGTDWTIYAEDLTAATDENKSVKPAANNQKTEEKESKK